MGTLSTTTAISITVQRKKKKLTEIDGHQGEEEFRKQG